MRVYVTETPLDRDPPLDRESSGQRPQWTETPLDRDLPLDRDPQTEPPADKDPQTETPWIETHPGQRPPRTDKHLWKHNLRRLHLGAVKIQPDLMTPTAHHFNWFKVTMLTIIWANWNGKLCYVCFVLQPVHIKRKGTQKLEKREQWKIRLRFHVGSYVKGLVTLGDCESKCERCILICKWLVNAFFWR